MKQLILLTFILFFGHLSQAIDCNSLIAHQRPTSFKKAYLYNPRVFHFIFTSKRQTTSMRDRFLAGALKQIHLKDIKNLADLLVAAGRDEQILLTDSKGQFIADRLQMRGDRYGTQPNLEVWVDPKAFDDLSRFIEKSADLKLAWNPFWPPTMGNGFNPLY